MTKLDAPQKRDPHTSTDALFRAEALEHYRNRHRPSEQDVFRRPPALARLWTSAVLLAALALGVLAVPTNVEARGQAILLPQQETDAQTRHPAVLLLLDTGALPPLDPTRPMALVIGDEKGASVRVVSAGTEPIDVLSLGRKYQLSDDPMRALAKSDHTVIVRLAEAPDAAPSAVLDTAILRGQVRLGALLPFVGRFFVREPLPHARIDG